MTETPTTVAARLTPAQRRSRLTVIVVLASALWLSALLIYVAFTRPAPGFPLIGPLVLLGPVGGFLGGWLYLRGR